VRQGGHLNIILTKQATNGFRTLQGVPKEVWSVVVVGVRHSITRSYYSHDHELFLLIINTLVWRTHL